jgi:hypothetical protein
VIRLFGISIHDPDVVFTDLGLALLAGYLASRLWIVHRGGSTRTGAVLLAGLASAALWGAVFHAFFPDDTATRAGFIAWLPVAFSIVVAATAMLSLALDVLLPRLSPTIRRMILGLYAAAFAGVVVLVDESFGSIVRFYVPALVLLLIAAGRQAVAGGGGERGWTLITAGLLVSVSAAVLQQAQVAIHPEYFDHNAVYHVVQAVAVVVLYRGFRTTPGGKAVRR